MRTLTTCLFPVAGLGTRFLPATKEIPKEMMPLLDRPIIHYGVEEAVQSGCTDVVFVTGRGKRSIEDYFDRSPELEELLESRGKQDLCEMVRTISQMARFAYVRQNEPLGLGHAVLCGEAICRNAPFGVILPDDVMLGNPPVLRQLMDVQARFGRSVVALEEVPREHASRYGIVKGEILGEGIWKITDLVEKPDPAEAPSNLAIMGRYVLSPGIFDELHALSPGAGGEYQLTDALRSLMEKEPLWGVVYRGERLDCGTKESWLEATVRLASKDPEMREMIRRIALEEGRDAEKEEKYSENASES